jgi:hypothetical protein
MLQVLKKKKVYVPLTGLVVLALAAGAFAYFTSTGSGTGSAAVGGASNWTVTDTSSAVTLYPGSGSFAVAGGVTNPAGGGNQLLSTLTVKLGAPTNAGTNSNLPACTAADFALSAPSGSGWTVSSDGDSASYTFNKDVASGSSVNFPSGLSVSMNDLQQDQGNCQGATVNWTDNAA